MTAQECYLGLLNATPPLVGPSYIAKPTSAPLYLALWKGGPTGNGANPFADNMPELLSYMFTPSDLALIAQWIKNGAPNN
jgi:hypothetical protein